MKKIIIVCTLVTILLLSACSSEGKTQVGPIANAGEDQELQTGSLVTLNASESTGPDEMVYKWMMFTKPLNSDAVLSDILAINPTFTADKDGNYTILLKVYSSNATREEIEENITESIELSSIDSVNIIATSKPIADAGVDQNVFTTTTVTLDGSGSYDANADALTYTWELLSKPTGSNATLSDVNVVNPYFVADIDGEYIFSLVVSDGEYTSSADSVVINASAQNIKPVADAGDDKVGVKTGSRITLDGSGSLDANVGDTLTYAWSITTKPAGSDNNLSDANISNPSFVTDANGSFVFSLVVSDGELSSDADTVTVTTTPNEAPVANAGVDIDLNSTVGASKVTIVLSGSGTDSHDDNLTYLWSMPSTADANLSGVTTATPTFEANATAVFTISLIVNDGELDSIADTLDINVTMN